MEKLKDYDDWKVYRFQCDCMDAGCCLDLEITTEEDGRGPIVIAVYDNYSPSLWKRIKTVFKYLFKRKGICAAEICVRKEDEANLIKVLQEHGWEDIHVEEEETQVNDPAKRKTKET